MIPGRLISRFDDLSVRHKILAGYAALIMPLMALVIVGGIMSARILTLSHRINDDSIPLLQALQSVRHFGITAIEATNTFALVSVLEPTVMSGATTTVDRQAEVLGAREAFSLAVQEYHAIGDSAGGADPTFRDTITFVHDDIIRQSGRIERFSAQGAPVNIVLELRDQFGHSAANFRSLIDAAINAERSELTERQHDLTRLIWLSAIIVIGFGITGIASAVIGGRRVSNHIAAPIRRLRDAALRIGEGDFEIPDQRRTADEVGELIGAFHTMVERLKDSMGKLARQERLATLGQLAGTVSHELRNPLAAIRNSLFSLRESVDSDSASATAKIVDRIERNVVRCDSIVGDLLNFARSGELKRDEVNADHWIETVLAEHSVPAGISLRHELRFDGTVPLDHERFRQVLVNLLDNAIQAINDPAWLQSAPGENTVTVRSERAGPYFQISVIDTGPGIPKPTLAKIFEPLFTTKSFGVGHGLTMVRQIVQQHGGTIDVSSEVGKGTTFVIRIPEVAKERGKAA